MIKTTIKKTMAALLCCGLCVSSGVLGAIAVAKTPEINGQTAYADGHLYLQDTGDNITLDDLTESFFAPNSNFYKYNEAAKDWLLPGGEASGSLTMKNNSSKPAKVYLYATETGANRNQKVDVDGKSLNKEYVDYYDANKTALPDDYTAEMLQNVSGLLVDQLQLNIKDGTTTVYDGMLNGAGSGPQYGMTSSKRIEIGTLAPNGGTKKFTFTLGVPSDLKSVYSDTNSPEYKAGLGKYGYSYAVSMIDWVFVIEYEETTTSTTTSTTQPTEPTTSTTQPTEPYNPPPRTGDAVIPYVVGSVLCGVSALAVFFIAFGNTGKKKRED